MVGETPPVPASAVRTAARCWRIRRGVWCAARAGIIDAGSGGSVMKVTKITESAAVPAGHEYFVGEVKVQPVVSASDGIDITVARVSAGARTYLHSHDVPQVLHSVEGRGSLAPGPERNGGRPGDLLDGPAREL